MAPFSQLHKVKRKTLRPSRHIDEIIKTKEAPNKLTKTCNQARINPRVPQRGDSIIHRRKRALVKTRRWAPAPEREYTEEGFGEIREESTCARASVPGG